MLWKLYLLLAVAAAYLFAIMPRLGQHADKMKGIFYAHRGLHDRKVGIPENSMAAFRAAVKAGYGIELDVRLTKDEEVVVFHDADLKRVCAGVGDIRDFTYKQLQEYRIYNTQERIPLLKDVLKLVDGKVPLLVELKSERLTCKVSEKTDALLRQYRGEYSIESFHPLILWWYRRNHPEVCRGQLSMNFQRRENNYFPAQILTTHLLLNFLGRPDFIAYDIRDQHSVSRFICRRLFGCPGAAWTVRSQIQLNQCRKYYESFIFEGFRPENK